MSGKFYLTTAIAYASKMPHIGNDYEIILSDCLVRYKKMAGFDSFMLTGTDDHGLKIQELAAEKGMDPQSYVDEVTGRIKENYRLLNINYDKFIRTTDDYHVRAVSRIFTKLYEQGDIYKGTYEGMYCTPCESFYTASQLVDGKCPDCGGEVKAAKEDAYYFRMSKYQERLVKHIEDNPDFIYPESRRKEMLNNFILPGVQDLCVSRSTFSWGVPVEFDSAHVVYVWLDALVNYITALGYDPTLPEGELYKKYWPCDVHIIGKDILRFHTIYWPCFLMALGLPLPKQIFGHPWMLFGADKMSKSKGNVIYSKQLADRFGVDAVRYYALSEMPFAQDGSITYEAFVSRYNSDLANTLGNLVNRTVAMIQKYFDGVIQLPCVGDEDGELINLALKNAQDYQKHMDSFHTADAVDCVMELLRRSNKYIDQTSPWILARDEANKKRLGGVLYNLTEAIRFAAVMLQPVMPDTSDSIFSQIGCAEKGLESLKSFGSIKAGSHVGDATPLFIRVDEEKVLADIRPQPKTEAAPAIPQPEKAQDKPSDKHKAEEVKPEEIDYDTFMKTDLRVAQVTECTRVEKSDKLLLLKLDLGYEKRQVVSGIAKWYTPEQMVGKKVVLVANLKPVKLRGVLSEGMILASGEEDVKLVDPGANSVPGDRIR
ncbi:MAG: methionine--tRNA ligase [Eubacteriales bacterium]